MRLHRVKVEKISQQMTLSPLEAKHLHVLRLRLGDSVQVFDGLGIFASAVITELEQGRAVLSLNEERGHVPRGKETPQPITLGIALLKGDKLADVVRVATELGVRSIVPLITKHADVREIGAQKLQRLRRIAVEASKQSERLVIPEVQEPVTLSSFNWEGMAVFAHPGSTSLLMQVLDWSLPINLLSGPEGGFAESEVSALQEKGASGISLGSRILRAETAPLAMLGAISAAGY